MGNSKRYKYYIYAAIVSTISLVLFVATNKFDNISSLLISCSVGLMPFLVDFFLFLDKTNLIRKDKTFRLLRGISRFVIGLIIAIIVILFLMWLPILQPSFDFSHLCFRIDNNFNVLNSVCEPIMSVIFSNSVVAWYYGIVFVISVAVRFLNTYFYSRKIENKIKKEENKTKEDKPK